MNRKIGPGDFDDQDLNSLLGHARNLEGKKLSDIAAQIGRADLTRLEGKGAAGQLLQCWFGLDANDNRDEPDLSVRDGAGATVQVEIKVVPLTARKRAGVRVKERCKVTNIDYFQLLTESWEASRAKHKLNAILFIFYDYAGKQDWQSSTVRKVLLWKLASSTSREIIRSDWQRTWRAVDGGLAHLISERHGAILGTSTAGAGRDARLVKQPKSDISAPKRAFSLKPAFLQTTFEAECERRTFESIETITGRKISASFQEDIITQLRSFAGLSLGELAAKTGIKLGASKNAVSNLLRASFGAGTGKSPLREVEELGINVKTVPVRDSNGNPWEAMSFPRTYLGELVEEEWENSEFLARLECLLILPVLSPERATPRLERRLAPPFFWQPTPDEWAGIEREWRNFQREIAEGHANVRFVEKHGRTQRVTKLTPGSKTEFIHMRPHSRDKEDFDETLPGTKAPVIGFWLNQSFVQRILRAELGGLGVHFPKI